MSSIVLTIGPGHTLREASKAMSQRRVGAAVVLDPDAAGPGLLTERDVLDAIGMGQNPDVEVVGEHFTSDVIYASPDWSLEEAAVAMVRSGLRGLIVLESGEMVGILSMRDVVRCWTDDGAIVDVPESAASTAQVRAVLTEERGTTTSEFNPTRRFGELGAPSRALPSAGETEEIPMLSPDDAAEHQPQAGDDQHVVRTLRFSNHTWERLAELAKRDDSDVGVALGQVINRQWFLEEHVRDGASLMMRRGRRTYTLIRPPKRDRAKRS